MKLFCDNCGFEEDELYEIDGTKYCEDCLESKGLISINTTKTYCANGEWFDEGELEDAVKYLDGKVIK